MSLLEWLEALSYIVTVVGLPFAIWVFIREQRKERQNDDEEVYLKLADDYEDFLKLVLQHADLRLNSAPDHLIPLSPEQAERRHVLFEILIALFERAYILAYEPKLRGDALRRWLTWEDYMRGWCRRRDFREVLPGLLEGEDAEFQQYIRSLAAIEDPQQPSAHRPGDSPTVA